MTEPSVSVVIPMYEAGAWIRETLVSVLQQTRPVRECIVVDDGSTDGGPAVVRRFEEGSGGLVKLIRTENRGVGAARNLGLAESSGDLVALLDADDLWNPRKLERQVPALLEADAVACLCAYEVFDTRSLQRTGVVSVVDARESLDRWLSMEGDGLLVSSTALVHRSAIVDGQAFRPSLTTGEDIEFALCLADRGEVVAVDEVLVGYRSHDRQAHRRMDDLDRCTAALYDVVFSGRREPVFERRCRANLHAHVGWHLLARRRWAGGFRRLRASWSERPTSVVALPGRALLRRVGRVARARLRPGRFFDDPRRYAGEG